MLEQEEDDNFGLILNVRSFTDFESMEVIPGHVVRRADEIEIHTIQDTLTSLAGNRPDIQSIWEVRWDDAHTLTEHLPMDLWRYFVVAFRSNNGTISELSEACCLSSVELDIGPTITRSFYYDQLGPGVIHYGGAGPGVTYNPGSFLQSAENLLKAGEAGYIDLTTEALEEIAAIWRALKAHDNTLIDIQSSVRQLSQLKALPAYSPMKFLGYFAVLESLLTHAPQPQDPYDSITRQVKRKMTLLDKRFPRRLDYAPFGGAAPETVWVRLYKYRSLIAHSGHARIEGDVTLLKSPEHAFSLLRSATTAVARQALLEPQLLADLREC